MYDVSMMPVCCDRCVYVDIIIALAETRAPSLHWQQVFLVSLPVNPVQFTRRGMNVHARS